MYRLVYITTPSIEDARRIGETLVSERLAACVNIYPTIESIYWWQGKMERDAESVLLAKTTIQMVEPLMEKVRAMHPYQCPCIVTLELKEGYGPFLEWIGKETRQ